MLFMADATNFGIVSSIQKAISEYKTVSQACKDLGIPRSTYYFHRKQLNTMVGQQDASSASVSPWVATQSEEQEILKLTEKFPRYSYLEISKKLKRLGLDISPGKVRGVWSRRGLTRASERLAKFRVL